MEVKIQNIPAKNLQSSTRLKTKPILLNRLKINNSNVESFKGLPNAKPLKPTMFEKLYVQIRHFFTIRRIANQSKQMISEVSKKYLADSGITNHSLMTFENTFAGGYFNPVDLGIVINKKRPKKLAISKFLPEYYKHKDIFKHDNYYLPCHEAQHKVQATQVYRIEGNQENFLKMMNNYIKEEKELLNNLKERTIFDDNISDIIKNLKFSKIGDIFRNLKFKKILMDQVKSEERKINNFDVNKIKEYYDEILNKKGFIPKGSEEEATAFKYLDAFANYPQLLAPYQKISVFGSKEARIEYWKKLNNNYEANFLEIDAKEKGEKYTEEHLDEVQKYFNKINPN